MDKEERIVSNMQIIVASCQSLMAQPYQALAVVATTALPIVDWAGYDRRVRARPQACKSIP